VSRIPRCAWAAIGAALAVLALALLAGGGPAGAAPARIPEDGPRLGRATAPVEIREYADLQCPFCRDAALRTVPGVVRDLVAAGRVRLVFRPLAFIGPDSLRGARAAVAAGRQDRLWPLVERLYRAQGAENSGWLSEARLRSAARAAGLDLARFDRDRRSPAALAALRAAQREAQAAGVRATPTWVVRGPRGTRTLEGVPTPAQVARAVRAVAPAPD
jgi:protein-disulfide isomerase